MILNLFIFLVLLFFLIFRYRDTVVIMAPLSPFLMMFYVPFAPSLPFNLFGLLLLCIIVLYPINIKLNKILNKKYPFWLPTLFLTLSILLSNYYAYEKHWYFSIMQYSIAYLYPIIFFTCLDNPRRLKLFIKTLLLFLLYICVYYLIELSTTSNPIIHFLMSNKLVTQDVAEITEIRFGIKRLQSFLGFHVAFGSICAIGFVTLLYLKMYYRDYIKQNNIVANILSFLLVSGVFFSGTRSAILGLIVGLFTFINYKKIKRGFTYIFFLIILAFPIGYFGSNYFGKIIDSFTHTENAGGSDSEMRQNQFDISLFYMAQSPLVGKGPGYISNIMKAKDEKIYGAESVWFPLMVDYGLLGCFAFAFGIIFAIYILIKKNMKPLIFFVLMFLTIKTMSSIPSINDGFYLLFVVFFIKLKELSCNE